MNPKILIPNLTHGAQVTEIQPNTWRLSIPAGKGGTYRLAQLDDYASLPRRSFAWKTGFRLNLEARASSDHLPGTWGFGLWNDPFSMGILSVRSGQEIRLSALRWLALPDAAWFFYGSPPNYLSLQDDLPAQDGMAATFRSEPGSAKMFLPLALFFPLLLIPPFMRLARRQIRKVVTQSAVALQHDPTSWHSYELSWEQNWVEFWVDGQSILHTPISPRGPLGLVIWLDNQYLALPPNGRLRYGMLPNPDPSWIEIRHLNIQQI